MVVTVKIKSNQKTTKLGPSLLRFTISRNPSDASKIVFLLLPGDTHRMTYRIAPDSMDNYTNPCPWRLDRKVGMWPWEAISNTRYETPEEAAKALQGRLK